MLRARPRGGWFRTTGQQTGAMTITTVMATARWDFLFVAAPLRIPDGTGSPVNPLAIF